MDFKHEGTKKPFTKAEADKQNQTTYPKNGKAQTGK